MKNKFLTLLAIAVCSYTHAQQIPLISQFSNNQLYYNPSFAGTSEGINNTMLFRYQWVDFDASPKTLTMFGSMRLAEEESSKGFHSFGYNMGRDKTGPSRTLYFSGIYAYNLPLSPKIRMSLGTSIGFKEIGINTDEIISIWPDPLLDGIDGWHKNFYPDLALGGNIYTDKLYLGVAVQQLFKGSSRQIDDEVIGALVPHYFLTGGARFDIESAKLAILPAVIFRFVENIEESIDINLTMKYNNLVWIGSSYRNEDTIVLLGGVTIKKMIDLGYSYDIITSNLKNYTSGSHEIYLSVRLQP